MSVLELADVSTDPIYRELLEEFPEAAPEAVEAALQFLRVAARMNLGNEALFERFGLTSGRFSLLMLLRREPGRKMSPSELAKRTNVSRASMTQFIDALEREQLVRRVDDPSDRRSMKIELTSRGDSLLKRVLPDFFRGLALFTQALSRSERRHLLELLEKVSVGVGELREP